VTLSRDAALHKERADDGGEHGDDELDDGLPSLQVFENFHKIKFSVCVGFVLCFEHELPRIKHEFSLIF